jgi:hypothetical protein
MPRITGRVLRQVDIRKPMHAAAVGLILAGILAPVANYFAVNERYRLSDSVLAVAQNAAPHLENKLKYDAEKHANVFNPDGGETGKDRLTANVGGGKNQLYTSTLPDDPSQGIAVQDNVNNVTVKFVPQMGLLGGRSKDGHVVYPLKDEAGQMIFTPKGNGLKEDIVLESAPKDDAAEFHYSLDVPASVQPRLEDDGSVGFYTAQPELFGDISYGTDKDREAVEKARENNTKTYLMFKIPAPTVRETGRGGHVNVRFELDGKDLMVRATGLSKGHYPLSIDPTFLLSSTSDWVLGSIDDNIDLSVANQIGRQALVGGSTPGWSAQHAPGNTGITTPNLTYAQFASSLVAYNGFLYMIGGGSGSGTSGTTTNDVRYISLDATTGALGTTAPTAWTNTGNSLLGTARQGLVAYGFNGYLYAIGGEDNSGNPITVASGHTVEYAKINSNGTVGTWAYGASLNTARSYPAGAIYQGLLYVMGGSSTNNNGTPLSTIEYSRIKGDGTLSAWTVSTALSNGNLVDAAGTTAQARSKFRGWAYNGFLYVSGGQTSGGAVLSTMQYAPIHSDGSVGAWVNTTAFPQARRDHGMIFNSGFVYIFAGCTVAAEPCGTTGAFIKDTMYAAVNADGTIGQWQSTLPYNSAINDTPSSPDYQNRMPAGVASYTNHLYFIGGCSAETATNNCGTQLVGTFITNIDAVGRYDRGIQNIQTTAPFNNNAATVSRMGAQAVALNGYLYLIGGCSVANCNTAAGYNSAVEYALVNSDGSLGTFNTTNALIDNSSGVNSAGRIGMSVVAYNDKVYVIGGVERNAAGTADAFRLDVLQSTQNPATGTLGTWTVATNSLPGAQAFAAAVVWHNHIYTLGGLSAAATVISTIYHSVIASNAPGTWATAKQTNGTTAQVLNNARWGHSGGIWGNWIYAVGGQSNTTGTYITAANGTEQITINNDGTLASVTTRNVTGASLTRLMGGFVHNGILYTFGGYTNGSTAAVATINRSSLDSATGVPGTWSAANIGNLISGTAGLSTARGVTTAVAYNGNFYVMGGCTAALATTSFSACGTFVSTAQTTEVNLVNNGGTGNTNAFSSATALPTATADHTSVAYNGVLYQIGGCTAYTAGTCTPGSNSSVIRSTPINPDTATAPGQLGSWTTSATSLPAGRSQLSAVAYNGYLYVIGGRTDSTAAVATVTYTTIGSTGTLGNTWSNADLPSGAERNALGAAVLNGYLYVAGGDDGSGSGTSKKNNVYYAQLSTVDGSLATSWTQNANSFTTARSGLSVVGYNGRLYVIGGSDQSGATLTDVQFASQANDGSLGTFAYTTDVPRGMSFRQAVGANGYMYFIGDEGSDTEITYADINSDGSLGLINRGTSVMAGAHAHGTASWFDGYFYIIGGCTLSSGVCTTAGLLTSDEFAGQQVISRVGHYSKLYNTQVDTSPTQVVINGANNGPGAAVEFKLQTASSTDPVLGVAQLIRPVIFGTSYNVQALNSSGTNVGVALNYLFLITLDDSRSGTFPDVAYAGDTGFAQTAVTDITMYYHANPGRRLRHGASFTSTDCNPAIPGASAPVPGCLLDTAP